MSVLSNVHIEPISTSCTSHKVTVDGKEIHHISKIAVDIEPASIPTCTITLNSASEIDEKMIVGYGFDPASIRECMRYLDMQLQFNEVLRQAWLMSIVSAIDDCRKNRVEDTMEVAKRVLDRIMS